MPWTSRRSEITFARSSVAVPGLVKYTKAVPPSEIAWARLRGAGPALDQRWRKAALRMQLVGGSPVAQSVGLDKQTGTSSYFIGSDPSQCQGSGTAG